MKTFVTLISIILCCVVFAQAQIVNKYSSKEELLQYHLKQLENNQHQPNQLIVKFNEKVLMTENGKTTSSSMVNSVLSEIQIKTIKPLFEKSRNKNAAIKAQFGLMSYYVLDLEHKTDLGVALRKLTTLDEVEVAEPDYLATGTIGGTIPDDLYYEQQWALNNTGQAVQWGTNNPIGTVGVDINMQDAWDIQTGSEDVVVCILDSGVDTDHPEFTGRIVPGYDFQFDDDDPNPIPGENAGAHGTCCAGIVGASGNNGIGVAGIAWHTKIMPVKVLYDNSGAWTIIANGIIWAADNGADIISMSIGGTSYSSTLEDAVDYAFSLGCTLFASSGNSNNDIGINPSYPAVLDNTICVGALSPCEERKSPTSCDGEYWWGSNYGSAMDFLAPGTRNYTTDITGSDGYDGGDYYPYFNGTSSACPHAAGIAALMLAENPSLSNVQIRAKMQMSCVDMGVAGKDDDSGYGRIDAYQALINANSDETFVRITPPNQWAAPGALFSIDFMIQNVTNLASYEFTFSYESDYMNFVDVDISDFLTSTGRTSVPSVVTPDPNGSVYIFNGTTGLLPTGPDGTARLFTVNFQVDENPPDFSTLQFNITASSILQPDGTPIIPTIVNNSVTIAPEYCKTGLYTTGCSDGNRLSYVGIANLENANWGCSTNGYGDFSYKVADVIQGQTYSLSLIISAGGHYVSAWIDYNDNMEFEPDEKILDDYNYTNANYLREVDITIAGDAAPGTHRLRVRTVLSTQGADACSLEEFGEMEDYTLNVLPQDQYCRIDGYVWDNFTYNSISGALIQLQPSGLSTVSNSMGYYCINVEEGTTSISCSASGYADDFYSSFVVDAGQTYRLDFWMFPEEGLCTEDLYGTGCWDGDGIEDFFFGDIYHPESGCSPDGYGDFTYMSTNLNCEDYYYVEVSSIYGNQYLNIWIDFNDNFTFEPEELILENEYIDMGGELYYFDVYLPYDECMPGEHIMRVRTNYNDPFYDACEWLEWGEVQDYTVYIEGDESYGALEGTVYNWDTGLPQANIQIEIQELGLSTISDADGFYEFDFVPAGEYFVSVNQAGYFQTAILAYIAPWETTTEDISAFPIHDNHFQIPQGWSGISSVYYMYQNVSSIFGSHSDDVVIISSMDGFYYPGQNINTLGRWYDSPGYKIKALNAFNFDYPGWTRKYPELSLPTGWSILPTWSACAVSIGDLFAGASSQPAIVKEIAGSRVYWPEFGINTLQVLEPGMAYFVMMESATVVMFPDCELAKSAAATTNPGLYPTDAELSAITSWQFTTPSPNTHTLAFPVSVVSAVLTSGDIIGAFDEAGNCYGVGVWQGENTSITLFGDDPTTAEKDGFAEGENLHIKVFQPVSSEEFMLELSYENRFDNSGLFHTQGISVVSGIKSTSGFKAPTTAFEDIQIIPNPARDEFVLSLDMKDYPEGRLNIRNIEGQIVAKQIITGNDTRVKIDQLKPGIYLLEIEINNMQLIRRLIKQ